MRVLSIVGARPQFVKAFAVSRQLRGAHEEVLVHTGQHYDHELSAVFFEELGIPEPEYNLGVGSDSPGRQTGRMIAELDPVLAAESPDVVVVYGDTNSTLAGTIVAAKSDPLLAHVEAGLRSGDREMPEEINRVIADHAADLLLVPTREAETNLWREGVTAGVHRTGDVMYDTLLWARDRAAERSSIRERLGVDDGEYVLATVHRARNTDDEDRLRRIVVALRRLDAPVVFPAHPRTVESLREADLYDRAREELTLTEPVGYLDFVTLLDGAERVVTDSGGVQKEAFFLDTPCVTLRPETEWPETVDAGWNVLVDADPDRIVEAVSRSYDLSNKPQPYGEGNAAEVIEQVLSAAVTGSDGRGDDAGRGRSRRR